MTERDPLSDPGAVAAYWRPLTDQELLVAPGLILVASILIRREFPNVDSDIASGVLDQALVDYVIAEMVKSAIESGNRPAAAKSQSETVGPYSRAVTYDGDNTSQVTLTGDLIALLAPAPTATIGSARLCLPHHPGASTARCWRPA